MPADGVLVLLVEDDPKNRKATSELFEANEFRVITAESVKDAVREMRACPTVDLVLTDVNLQKDPEDHSGVELAQTLHATYPELPVVGYSGHFSEGDLAARHWEKFTTVRLKGRYSISELKKDMDVFREQALRYRRKRLQRAADEVERLRQKYAIDPHDVNLLREFIPGGVQQGDPPTIEEILGGAGYRLRIIEKGERVAVATGERIVGHSFAVWLQQVEGSTVAEVFGRPYLYAGGDTEEEALQNLLTLMEGYRQDLQHNDAESFAQTVEGMRAFLDRVLA